MRLPAVDAARGSAIVHMVAYHFCAFAAMAGLLDADLSSWPWVVWQRSIAGTFFLLVGVSLVLASLPTLDRRAFAWRQGKLAVFAAVVTVASWVMVPEWLVVFGILHSIFVCSWLALPLVRRPWVAVGVGLVILVLSAVESPAFDGLAWVWTGLAAHPVPTFDRQPLVPWLGVVLLGIGLGHVWRARSAWHGHDPGLLGRGLGWLGRWSIWIYMAHVPVLLAIVGLWQWSQG